MSGNLDSRLLRQAVDEAWKYQGLTYPNPAVGATISTKEGFLIALGVHKQAGSPHAEVEAIKEAYIKLTNDKDIKKLTKSAEIHEYLIKNHNGIFFDKTLHVSLEPCNHFGKTPPCSLLIKELGFKRVVIGTKDTDKKASGGYEYLKANGIETILLEDIASKELIEPFVKWRKKRFVFFKLAMSLNGVIAGGKISSKDSFEFTHKLRDKIDLLVIGGDTVRVDRPTLDCRFIKGEAPDILIYSKRDDFDRTIPLFNVSDRRVYIADSFEILKEYNFIMVEGGEGMLKATKGLIDNYLFIKAPLFKDGFSPKFDMKLEELSSFRVGKDRFGWYKPII